jgi:hypothetical protein
MSLKVVARLISRYAELSDWSATLNPPLPKHKGRYIEAVLIFSSSGGSMNKEVYPVCPTLIETRLSDHQSL